MPNNEPPVEVIQGEERAREVLAAELAKCGLLKMPEWCQDAAIRAMLAFQSEVSTQGEEYVTVTLSRDGTVTSHNAFDADFDEMVAATEKIIKALSIRLSDRKFCPYSHGSALKHSPPSHPLQADREAIARVVDPAAFSEKAYKSGDPAIDPLCEWTIWPGRRQRALRKVDMILDLHAALPQAPSPTFADGKSGWLLMPAEPTPEMIAAAWDVVTEAKNARQIQRLGPGVGTVDVYRAMVAAIRSSSS